MNNNIVNELQPSTEIARANAPAWAFQIDDEWLADPVPGDDAIVLNYGDRGDDSSYLMRCDSYGSEGPVVFGDLKVRVWAGGNSLDLTVTAETPDELRKLAVDLQKVAGQLDDFQAGVE